MMLTIKHLDVKLPLRDYIPRSRHSDCRLTDRAHAKHYPPGIVLWDINLGVNIYPTFYYSVGYARGTLYTP